MGWNAVLVSDINKTNVLRSLLVLFAADNCQLDMGLPHLADQRTLQHACRHADTFTQTTRNVFDSGGGEDQHD